MVVYEFQANSNETSLISPITKVTTTTTTTTEKVTTWKLDSSLEIRIYLNIETLSEPVRMF